ncbi:glycosyl transferase family 2 [Caldicellulosiruptor kronotskyensis 2002]|uniref:Glycosyl transferase family 2 n=1 Tax=Caldicellulosiruptor kronotskyensis (strain DSM 18902 / VKM B-2412 / 2002) TaxID=632348 RepID=E4SGZ7_CALK2|nr:glycosyltransferase [Caldicellulosiruptor kronotskyensis]ADQ47022.1 glycosyl transferase family 2 [Caldicellulosiruptor kronotskyensis 2002]
MRHIINWFSWFVSYYVLVLNTIYAILILISFFGIVSYWRNKIKGRIVEIVSSDFAPPVSLLVPAYNEEETIAKSVKSFLQIEYPEYEVVVINDGSKDGTLDVLKNEFDLYIVDRKFRKILSTKEIKAIYYSKKYSNLIVVDKENGGKADALNAGINVCTYPYVCSLDADSILERDSIAKVMQPFFDNPYEVVATTGIVRIVNGSELDSFGNIKKLKLPSSSLARFQIIEYLRAFLGARKGLSMIGSLVIASGAFAAFNKNAIIKVGGFSDRTVGEDMEIVVKLRKNSYKEGALGRVEFVPDPIVWTQCPETLKDLSKQRRRWQRGLCQVIFMHKDILFNPKYGILGLFAMPYQLMFELLGPFVEMLGYIFIPISYFAHIINLEVALFFFAVEIMYGIVISILAVLLGEFSDRKYEGWREFGILVLFAILENFGYRQMTVLFRIVGTFEAILRKKGWAKPERKKL